MRISASPPESSGWKPSSRTPAPSCAPKVTTRARLVVLVLPARDDSGMGADEGRQDVLGRRLAGRPGDADHPRRGPQPHLPREDSERLERVVNGDPARRLGAPPDESGGGAGRE